MANPQWRVPSAAPAIDEADIAAVTEVLRSGVLANGPQAAALEDEFASYCGVSHAVSVSNGTVALVLAGQALGLGRGDVVLVSGFTFAASANAFLSLGCEVVPLDVDETTMNADAGAFADTLRAFPQASAVVVVDLFGSTTGTDEVIAQARDAGLLVIEDAAQAHGALDVEGQRVGKRADVTTFSLYATKNLSAGEGGLVTTTRAEPAEAVRRLRNHGGIEQYQHEQVGLNARLPEMAAALARCQLTRLEERNTRRRENARMLTEWCQEAWGPDAALPAEATAGATGHVFHQFTVRFRDQPVRDAVAASLRAAGVDARQFYPYTVAELPGVTPHPTPIATSLRDRVLSIPVHPGLDASLREDLRRAILSTALPVAAR